MRRSCKQKSVNGRPGIEQVPGVVLDVVVPVLRRRLVRSVALRPVVEVTDQPAFVGRLDTCSRQAGTRRRAWSLAERANYLISVSILNIGRYIEMMITPTIMPTPIIMIGSMIEVSDWMAASTSSS